ncbi:MAG: hydrogenase maturation nickel metallochaperone HypA [Deltaproteobacteria bacterium HGW-Deltaproteobacteria-19]|nr:MAG: hydrogenase maturation nickel metallochaperone HypA [Deltaproteobacteria bacterium HGW-Deltaproteobacteria-19]
MEIPTPGRPFNQSVIEAVMHELPVMESVLKIVLGHAERNRVRKIVAIHLKVGELSDLIEDWMQRYFDYVSKGTLAEGAVLKIQKIPVRFRCSGCSSEFTADVRKEAEIRCPECGADRPTLISGREYFIENMEVI